MNEKVETEFQEAYSTHTTLFAESGSEEIKARLDVIHTLLQETPLPPQHDQLYVREDNGGHWFPLKAMTRIGRVEDGNDLVLDSKYVSDHHCVVEKVGVDWWLKDLNSANGIRVNKKKVKEHRLVNGDIIQITDRSLIFFTQQK